MTTNHKPVSIKPVDFSTDLPDLSKMSLEEVVARFKDTEKKRNKRTEPDGEAEVYYPVYHAPVELMSSIKMAVEHLHVSSRAVLTKCMTRQVVDWYTNNPELISLTTMYKDIYSKIKQRRYTVLRIQAENPPKFSFCQQPEEVSTSVNTIRWATAKLGELHAVMGMNVIELLLAGFCYCFTTLDNCDWDRDNVDQSFQPEVDNIGTIIQCRKIDIQSLYTKFQLFEENRK